MIMSEFNKHNFVLIYQQISKIYSIFYTIPMRPKVIRDPFSLPKIQSRSTSRSSTNNIINQIQNKLLLPFLQTNYASTQSSFKEIKTGPIKTYQKSYEMRLKSEDRNLNRKLTVQSKESPLNNLQNHETQIKKKSIKREKTKIDRVEKWYEDKYKQLKNNKVYKKSITDYQNLRLVGQIGKTTKYEIEKQPIQQDTIFGSSTTNLSIILQKKVSQEQSLRDIDEYLKIVC